MKKFNLLILSSLSFVFFLLSSPSFSQQDSFNNLFNSLKAAIKPVETAKYTYDSELTFINTSVIKYGFTKTSTSGTAKTYEYELNFADIDPYTVRESVEKDVIKVNVKIKNSQKLIKLYEDRIVKSYINELSFVATDIDDAREIRKIIEETIPISESIMKNKLKLSTYESMLKWLEDNVKDAVYETKAYNQTLVRDAKYAGKIDLTIIEAGKTSKQSDYSFNLADINLNTLNFKIVGSEFGLTFETIRKHNLIKLAVDGESKPFINDIEIMANNVEEARDLRTVLSLIIPLSKKEVDASFPKITTQQAALDALSSYVRTINYGKETYEQKLNAGCLTEYSNIAISESKSTTTSYNFNWMDINDKVIDYDISGSKMFIEIFADKKQKLLSVKKEGEIEPYDESFKIYCEDAENARRMKHALVETITRCRDNYKYQVPSGDANAKFKWLMGAIKEVRVGTKTYNQRVERVDAVNNDKFKFTKLIISEKGGAEYIYELNFSDLAERNVNYDISGKSVSISVETNFKEKIIKAYKDGEIQNYEEEFSIEANNIEEARNIIKALVDIITLLKES